VFQPIEIAFASLALLLVLHRVKDFAFGTQSMRSAGQLRNKNLVVRSFIAVVALLILLGHFSAWAASAYFLQGSNLNSNAEKAYSNNNTADGDRLRLDAARVQSQGDNIVGIMRIADAAMLLLIVLAFITMAAFSSKAIQSALRTLFKAEQKYDEVHALARGAAANSASSASFEQNKKLIAAASMEGRRLRLKILSTFTFAFIALLLRAMITLIYAVASVGQDNSNPCNKSYCSTCKNIFSNFHGWLLYTPSFQFVAVLVSSPLATAVALWGMSGVRVLDSLTSAPAPLQMQTVSTGAGVSMSPRSSAQARISNISDNSPA
jgi:hypothetical protein